jgi:hypothetical protein
MSKDIDWLAVDMVCSGASMHHLTRAERKMVVRRLADRMLRHGCSPYAVGLSTDDLANRLGVSGREVERLKAELPDAQRQTCPVCHEPMWVAAGVAEAHPDRLFSQCPMSGRQLRSGLAAIRPDLYGWLDEVSA